MDNFKENMKSPLFTFLVGKEKVPVVVHPGFIKHHSEPLYAMITNETMKETQTRVVTIEDVEEDIFLYGFCGYVYSGTYATPTSRECKELQKYAKSRSSNSKLEKLKQIYATSAENNGFHGEKIDDYHFASLWESFRQREFDLCGPLFPRGLLFHAKLYTFSTKYLIEGLSRQCLNVICSQLRCHNLSAETSHTTLNLLDYTYAKTGRVEPTGKSQLRDLVIHYVACKLPILAEIEEFWTIIDSDSETAVDLVGEMLK
ncbi:hypothetical protein DPV78_006210 [Talaromyces pinophilus]|nr:hypothetical protein DPV78_006210 [Talaromyces pinophilus]